MDDFIYELVGAIYGDGHIHSSAYRVTLVGSLEDYFYYTLYLKPLLQNLFPSLKIYVRRRNEQNSYYLIFESKKVFSELQNFCLWRGVKSNLPVPILPNSNALKFFLRGLFDTDGSLKFSKQQASYNYYPRIQYAFMDTPFSRSLGNLLTDKGFSFSFYRDKRNNENCYQISGNTSLLAWVKEIGFSNPVHKTKFLYWQKFGYSLPKSSLNSRIEALHLKIEALF